MSAWSSEPEGPYVSVHVPKTGGMTLLEPLVAIFGDRLQRAYHPPVPGRRASATDGWPDVERPLCIHGHAVFRRFGHLLALPNTRWITFLRDPLARAISTWHHRRRHVPWDPASDRPPTSATLDEFLLDEFPAGTYATLVALSGRTSIRDFDMVGITERFDESMLLLYRRFGWPQVPFRPRNLGRYPPQVLEPGVREAFERRCAADYWIYAEARRALEERIASYEGAFAEDLEALRSRAPAASA